MYPITRLILPQYINIRRYWSYNCERTLKKDVCNKQYCKTYYLLHFLNFDKIAGNVIKKNMYA